MKYNLKTRRWGKILSKATGGKSVLNTSVAMLALCYSDMAIAQGVDNSSSGQSAQSGDAIIVTARKRDERLIDAPLAIQAFTSAQLEESGIENLEDLTLFSPGLDYKNQSASNFTGRYLPAIRFRGLTSSSSLPSSQVGSVFVDGVYVLGGAQSIGFEDIAQVEVIKGPQAAYFGRSTFGGAVNYTTADPSDEFGGKVSADYAPRYGSHNISATIEGPLIGDVLRGRVTASTMENSAYETATDGGRLGEETTDAIHLSFVLEPNSSFKAKFRSSFIEDEDTAPASTFIQFSEYGNCLTGTPFTVLDGAGAERSVTLQGDYVCGALPENVPVTSNTTFYTLAENGSLPEADIRAIFVENALGIAGVDGFPDLDHYGLRRKTQRHSANFSYDLSSSLSVSGTGAYNKQRIRQFKDADFSDGMSVHVAPANFFRDYSGELRVNYEHNSRLRVLAGVNYYNQTVVGAFGNAIEVTNEFLLDSFDPPFSIRVLGLQNSGNNNDKVETIGVFGSVEYDFTDWFTLSLEGRYQEDEVTNFSGSFNASAVSNSLTSKEFLPRVIGTFHPIDGLTVYGSYSEGTLPGQFNPQFLALSESAKAELQLTYPTLQDAIPAEQLKNYEIGIKQEALDGLLTYAIAVYYMEWDNMKSNISFVPPGATGLQGALISGSSEIKGVEFEGALNFDKLQISATANYNDATYKDFIQSGSNILFGLSALEGYRVDGKRLPLTPEWSGSLSLSYSDTLTEDWDWFGRVDTIYQGKTFTNATNLNWVDDYNLVNLRVGIENDTLRLGLYASNLFDEGGWTAGATGLDLTQVPVLFSTLNTLQGATVTSMRGREIGVSASFKF